MQVLVLRFGSLLIPQQHPLPFLSPLIQFALDELNHTKDYEL
jgi:hypothetical protein